MQSDAEQKGTSFFVPYMQHHAGRLCRQREDSSGRKGKGLRQHLLANPLQHSRQAVPRERIQTDAFSWLIVVLALHLRRSSQAPGNCGSGNTLFRPGPPVMD